MWNEDDNKYTMLTCIGKLTGTHGTIHTTWTTILFLFPSRTLLNPLTQLKSLSQIVDTYCFHHNHQHDLMVEFGNKCVFACSMFVETTYKFTRRLFLLVHTYCTHRNNFYFLGTISKILSFSFRRRSITTGLFNVEPKYTFLKPSVFFLPCFIYMWAVQNQHVPGFYPTPIFIYTHFRDK